MSINVKKYRVPIEMDKEYAAQIGIDPNEIRYIMLGGKLTSVYFVEIADEQLYRELMRPIWREEKELERSKKCAVSNEHGKLIRCDGNCATCPHTKSGTPISIDAMEEIGGFRSTQDGVHRQQDSATYTASTEDIVMYNWAAPIIFGEFAGELNDVPEPPEWIKRQVERKCEPYKIEAMIATQPCGIFYTQNKEEAI